LIEHLRFTHYVSRITTMDELVVFRLGSSEWALPADRVHQILAPRPVTRLPDPPPLVCGLVAWRAQVLPVIALEELPDCSGPPVERCTLIVTEAGGELIALAVDEVLNLAESAVQPLNLEQMLNEH
jgi:chemotaxis signal transduction protein